MLNYFVPRNTDPLKISAFARILGHDSNMTFDSLHECRLHVENDESRRLPCEKRHGQAPAHDSVLGV